MHFCGVNVISIRDRSARIENCFPEVRKCKKIMSEELSEYAAPIEERKDQSINRLTKENYEATETVFIWIDILGFSAIVEDSSQYEALSSLLGKFKKKFNETSDYNASVISDGIILELNPNRYNWSNRDFTQCFDEISKKQAEFACETETLIRGGIAVGTKRYNDNGKDRSFVSNGLARAYNIESHNISWPVIGTTESQMRKLENLCSGKMNDYFCRAFDSCGKDVYFLDYFSRLEQNQRQAHYTFVVKKMEEFDKKLNEARIQNSESSSIAKIQGIRAKYMWLCKYFQKDDNDFSFPQNYQGCVL